jgi:hypothetical protein
MDTINTATTLQDEGNAATFGWSLQLSFSGASRTGRVIDSNGNVFCEFNY